MLYVIVFLSILASVRPRIIECTQECDIQYYAGNRYEAVCKNTKFYDGDKLRFPSQIAILHLENNDVEYLDIFDGHQVEKSQLNILKITNQRLLYDIAPHYIQLYRIRVVAITGCPKLIRIPRALMTKTRGGTKAIMQFSLTHNGITTVEKEWLPYFNSSRYIDLSNNMIRCDCNILWLLEHQKSVPRRLYRPMGCIDEHNITANLFGSDPDNICLNGVWTQWGYWSRCASCSEGHSRRTRVCANRVPNFASRNCTGQSLQQQSCVKRDCSVDGGWSTWQPWSTCPSNFGVRSFQHRERACDNPLALNGGRMCSGNRFETQMCVMHSVLDMFGKKIHHDRPHNSTHHHPFADNTSALIWSMLFILLICASAFGVAGYYYYNRTKEKHAKNKEKEKERAKQKEEENLKQPLLDEVNEDTADKRKVSLGEGAWKKLRGGWRFIMASAAKNAEDVGIEYDDEEDEDIYDYIHVPIFP